MMYDNVNTQFVNNNYNLNPQPVQGSLNAPLVEQTIKAEYGDLKVSLSNGDLMIPKGYEVVVSQGAFALDYAGNAIIRPIRVPVVNQQPAYAPIQRQPSNSVLDSHNRDLSFNTMVQAVASVSDSDRLIDDERRFLNNNIYTLVNKYDGWLNGMNYIDERMNLQAQIQIIRNVLNQYREQRNANGVGAIVTINDFNINVYDDNGKPVQTNVIKAGTGGYIDYRKNDVQEEEVPMLMRDPAEVRAMLESKNNGTLSQPSQIPTHGSVGYGNNHKVVPTKALDKYSKFTGGYKNHNEFGTFEENPFAKIEELLEEVEVEVEIEQEKPIKPIVPINVVDKPQIKPLSNKVYTEEFYFPIVTKGIPLQTPEEIEHEMKLLMALINDIKIQQDVIETYHINKEKERMENEKSEPIVFGDIEKSSDMTYINSDDYEKFHIEEIGLTENLIRTFHVDADFVPDNDSLEELMKNINQFYDVDGTMCEEENFMVISEEEKIKSINIPMEAFQQAVENKMLFHNTVFQNTWDNYLRDKGNMLLRNTVTGDSTKYAESFGDFIRLPDTHEQWIRDNEIAVKIFKLLTELRYSYKSVVYDTEEKLKCDILKRINTTPWAISALVESTDGEEEEDVISSLERDIDSAAIFIKEKQCHVLTNTFFSEMRDEGFDINGDELPIEFKELSDKCSAECMPLIVDFPIANTYNKRFVLIKLMDDQTYRFAPVYK